MDNHGVSGSGRNRPDQTSSSHKPKSAVEERETVTSQGRKLKKHRPKAILSSSSQRLAPEEKLSVRSVAVQSSSGERAEKLRADIRCKYESGTMTENSRAQLDQARTDYFREANIPHYDVVVVGEGPAGLMTAIEQARQGRSVCILESRSDEGWDIRSSVMRVGGRTRVVLSEMLNTLESKLGPAHVFSHKKKSDIDHHKSLQSLKKELSDHHSSGMNIQTDVIQRIYHAFAEQEYAGKITVKRGVRADNFEPWLQTVKPDEDSAPIAFDNIVHADGANGKSRQALVAKLGIPTEKEEMPTMYAGMAQCAYLQSDEFTQIRSGEIINERSGYKPSLIKKLKKFGWTSKDLPVSYMFKSHPASNKVWIAGQCPPGLNSDRQLEWNKLLCQISMAHPATGNIQTKLKDLSYIKTDRDTERGLKKANLSHAIFDLKKHALIDPVVDTVFGKSISVGDAAETPSFFNAEGIANALTGSFNVNIDLPYRTLVNAPDNKAEVVRPKMPPAPPPQSAKPKMPPAPPPQSAKPKMPPAPPPQSAKPKTAPVQKSILSVFSQPFQMLKALWNKIR